MRAHHAGSALVPTHLRGAFNQRPLDPSEVAGVLPYEASPAPLVVLIEQLDACSGDRLARFGTPESDGPAVE